MNVSDVLAVDKVGSLYVIMKAIGFPFTGSSRLNLFYTASQYKKSPNGNLQCYDKKRRLKEVVKKFGSYEDFCFYMFTVNFLLKPYLL
jgi:hypothetical protein